MSDLSESTTYLLHLFILIQHCNNYGTEAAGGEVLIGVADRYYILLLK